MLELRPICENCEKELPNESLEAMICSFECTFCKDCVDNILDNICPNCGGGFEKRPTRPALLLNLYPESEKRISKVLDKEAFERTSKKYKNIPPNER